MANNTIKTRIINKHDAEANWNKATNFIPLKGEVIIYDRDDYDNPDGYFGTTYSRIKIGDGETKVSNLPFIDDQMTESEVTSIFTEVFGS